MIPFFGLAVQQVVLRREIEKGNARILTHEADISVPEVAELKEKLAALLVLNIASATPMGRTPTLFRIDHSK